MPILAYTGGLVQTNAYLIEVGSMQLLIDAPQGVAEWIKAQDLKVDALLLTHQHWDHVMDAGEIQREYQCPVYAQFPKDEELVLAKRFTENYGIPIEVSPYEVTHLLPDASTIAFGGEQLVVTPLPGHSKDSLVFYSSAQSWVASGDTLMASSIGRADLPGGNHALLLKGIREVLMTLSDEVKLLSGHGPMSQIGTERRHNPYI